MNGKKSASSNELVDEGVRAEWRRIFPRLVEVLGDPLAKPGELRITASGPGYIESQRLPKGKSS